MKNYKEKEQITKDLKLNRYGKSNEEWTQQLPSIMDNASILQQPGLSEIKRGWLSLA